MSLINAQTDFGVVLDGVTDNTTNLQAAANAAANGRLYIPAGVCVMGPVQFPANVEIFGDLIGSTILKRKDNTPHIDVVVFALVLRALKEKKVMLAHQPHGA